MSSFNDLRIGVRLGLGFAVLIAAALAIALYARTQLGSINDSLKLLVDDRVDKIRIVNEVKDNVGHIASAIRTLALLDDPKAMQEQRLDIDRTRARNGALLQELDRRIQSPTGRELLKELNGLRPAYNDAAARVADLGLAMKRQDAVTELLGPLKSAQDAYIASLDRLIAFQTELMAQTNQEADETVSWSSTLMIALAALTGSFGAFIAWIVTRSITAPIREAVAIAETVAAGDLRSRIDVRSKDETGQLLGALQRMNDSLLRIVSTVRGNAESVSTASMQIAQGNADLSQRTEEQASNLQQTAASMEQLTATVKQNAETAQTASQLAVSASDVATRGGTVVGQAVSTMEAISESSKKIADIIGVIDGIDGIAFQTNILALNAAVEAPVPASRAADSP